MELIYLSVFILLFNFIIYLKFETIAAKFIFFDKPDGKLKKHKNPISLIGGFIVLINLYLIIFFLKLLHLENSIFTGNYAYAVIILSTFFYLIGFIDDLKNLSPNKKLLWIIFSTAIILLFFPELRFEHIKISFYENVIFFKYSFICLILCFALLSNALNMFDGINLQLILYTIFIFFVFILKGFIPIFFALLIISLIFLSILNYKNKVFLGDGGSYLISSVVGCTFIFQYKNYNNFLFTDEVFVILLIPAIDMLRLFIVRIVNKKHPFKGDLNHLHHIVNRLTKNTNKTLFINLCLCMIPSFLLFLNLKTYNILILSILVYFSLILYVRLKV